MPPMRVKVDGELWWELSRHKNKREAKKKAGTVRKQHVKARVRKFSFGYVVAVEPKTLRKFEEKRK